MNLEHRIPPPLVAVLTAAVMWGLSRLLPGDNVPFLVCAVPAGMLALAGLAVMLAGVWSFRRARTTVNPLRPASASALVTGGIYRWTRNPMYLGMATLLLAWAAWLASPAALPGVLLFVAYIQRFQIQPEEEALERLFGDGYRDYCARVRRWL